MNKIVENNRIKPTFINGVVELISDIHFDERGVFRNGFRSNDSTYDPVWGDRQVKQINVSKSFNPGTIRGLHLQKAPHSEAKIIKCLHGKIWDVVVDLRKDSLTYGKWYATELSETNNKSLFIPEGCAHGFQVLDQDSELLYTFNEVGPKG